MFNTVGVRYCGFTVVLPCGPPLLRRMSALDRAQSFSRLQKGDVLPSRLTRMPKKDYKELRADLIDQLAGA